MVLDFCFGHWKCPNREGGKGQFRVKVAFSSLLSFLERLDWPMNHWPMWKVGGIKIESAAGRRFFLLKWNGTSWKTEKFKWESFSGQVPTVEILFYYVLHTRSWETPVECELPAKIGWCNENLAGRNFDFRAKSSLENFFIYILNILSGGFCSRVKIAAGQVFVTPPEVFFSLLK